ncbi:response regulator [Pseudokineococcus sp. 5B2Z-1]|uniref:response regulator n=1 Tax=Pseudokineococcus sp. 5B2Z-1 TaxID=3132744 RepID=UPI0026119A17|nr:response regulator [uncultured Pseudokineococcus sp.]
MRVLVVDDSRVMRQIVVRALRQAGFGSLEVVEAGDGGAGLEKVAEESPDLVLCDWNMPGTSGIEMLQQLRAGGDRTPFGFITSEAASEVHDRASAAGATFVVTKPFTPEVLHDAIESALAGVAS